MNVWEPRWLANSNPLRLFFYLLLPVLLCAGSAYEQSTSLQRHYLFPYLESSILRHSLADTTGVQMYLKLSKDRKQSAYLTEDDVVPVLVIVGDALPFELSSSAQKKKWKYIELGGQAQVNSAFLAGFLETKIFDGESMWHLLWPTGAEYCAALLMLILLRLFWLERGEFLQWLEALWQSHQEQNRLIAVQFPVSPLCLPAPSKPLLSSSSPRAAVAKSLQVRPPKPPANGAGWSPSLWVDRSELTQKDSEEN